MRPLALFLGRLAAVVVLALAAWTPAGAGPTFPSLTGRVVDNAHVLSPAVQADLTAKLSALEARNGTQVVVVTLPSLQGYAIEDYGYQLGRAWGIGQKGKNNGALFIVAPSDRKVRIEVGYGLEPVLTDALTSVILQRAVLPKFRAGDVEGGVVDGTNAIVGQLGLDPQEAVANAQAAEQQVRADRSSSSARPPAFPSIIVIFFVILFIISILRRGGGGGLWALPFLFMGGGGRYRDDGGGFGGGGFSGGGGSFGGGGSSGSW